MANPEQPKPHPRRKFFSRKMLGRFLFICACVVTLAALLVVEENWRGKRAWENCKRELEAAGEHTDAAYYVPPQIPDDQNFAMCPPIKDAYYYIDVLEPAYTASLAPNVPHASLGEMRKAPPVPPIMELPQILSGYGGNAPRPVQKTGGWQTGRPEDLQPWQVYYRAQFPHIAHPQSPEADVLVSLAGMDDLLAALREADKTRPLSRFPVKYELGPETGLPHISMVQQLSRVLALRVVAELRSNHTDDAFADMQLLGRLLDLTKDEPIFISQLARTVLAANFIGPVWEGIRLHRWSDAQLTSLQTVLRKIDFLSDYTRAIRSQRIATEGEMLLIRREPTFVRMYSESMPPSDLRLLSATKYFEGWIYQNIAAQNRWLQQSLSFVNVKTHRVDLQGIRDFEKILRGKKSTPYTFLAKFSVPQLMACLVAFAGRQTYVDEAIIACAIERYRMAHGALPPALDDLHLENLPHDVTTGGPLHYRVVGNDYLLYSPGWNGADDGGKPVLNENGHVNMEQGDWVWSLTPL